MSKANPQSLFNLELRASCLRNEDNMKLQQVKPITLLTISNRVTNKLTTNKPSPQWNTLDFPQVSASLLYSPDCHRTKARSATLLV